MISAWSSTVKALPYCSTLRRMRARSACSRASLRASPGVLKQRPRGLLLATLQLVQPRLELAPLLLGAGTLEPEQQVGLGLLELLDAVLGALELRAQPRDLIGEALGVGTRRLLEGRVVADHAHDRPPHLLVHPPADQLRQLAAPAVRERGLAAVAVLGGAPGLAAAAAAAAPARRVDARAAQPADDEALDETALAGAHARLGAAPLARCRLAAARADLLGARERVAVDEWRRRQLVADALQAPGVDARRVRLALDDAADRALHPRAAARGRPAPRVELVGDRGVRVAARGRRGGRPRARPRPRAARPRSCGSRGCGGSPAARCPRRPRPARAARAARAGWPPCDGGRPRSTTTSG